MNCDGFQSREEDLICVFKITFVCSNDNRFEKDKNGSKKI